jgi:protein phosphatase
MLEYHAQTDVGRRREHNEDTLFADPRLLVVCDGMGGHAAGEVASKLATDAIAKFVHHADGDPDLTWPFGFDADSTPDRNRLENAIKVANGVVYRESNASEERRGMGTTVVAVLFAPSRGEITYGNVGDSRIYLIRGDTMSQLSVDDSWSGFGGEDVPSMKNVLTKALGIRAEVDFEVTTLKLEPGDIILLCSDGLTNMLTDTAILDLVLDHGGDLGEACRRLVATANDNGGRDNVSVVLARYGGPG